ncbi:MAG: hypothetical protein D6744_08025, partial [Planctomycetota bacterium]
MPPRSVTPRVAHGRDAAMHAVLAVFRREGFADEVVRSLSQTHRLGSRETGLAMEIARGAIRHHVTIEHVLTAVARYESKRVAAPLRAILHCAAYQIIWLDRIPPHAAVDQAVDQASRFVHRRAAGMANAVLRRLTGALLERNAAWRAGDPRCVRTGYDSACRFQVDVLAPMRSDADHPRHVAAATGERLEHFRSLCERFGAEQAEQIGWARQGRPVTVLQRNALVCDADEFARAVRDAWGPCVDLAGEAAFVSGAVNPTDLPLFRAGGAFVQDATARAAADWLAARPGERVLDLCAAPGGKTAVLAMAMGDRGEIVACDVGASRLAPLRENIARLRLSSAWAHPLPEEDAGGDDDVLRADSFDAVLVDAPCSNSGVFARRPEARLGFSRRKLASLTALQVRLLHRAAACVRRGGRLVYS